ncbi:MAG: sigma-70 family RNA polymerase sigma factor [Candidatus Nealsonbacteria bacterium]|nr:sigma-70 family RNA polymerase sigma factor [Candidatus Nealsonbacteria bacterium]
MSSDESANLLVRFQAGDEAAAEEIFRRYAQQLCRLAEKRIGAKLARRVGPEDVVQSALRTFFRRAENGEFKIDHRGALWNLLVKIMLNKIYRQAERHGAGKRDVKAEVECDSNSPRPEAVAHEPTAEEAALLDDELEFLLAKLKDPEPEIVRLSIQGYSTSDIVERVGHSRWYVRHALNRVGGRLQKRLQDSAIRAIDTNGDEDKQ